MAEGASPLTPTAALGLSGHMKPWSSAPFPETLAPWPPPVPTSSRAAHLRAAGGAVACEAEPVRSGQGRIPRSPHFIPTSTPKAHDKASPWSLKLRECNKKTETECPLMKEWMNKMWQVHTMDYYSSFKRKDTDACCNMAEP